MTIEAALAANTAAVEDNSALLKQLIANYGKVSATGGPTAGEIVDGGTPTDSPVDTAKTEQKPGKQKPTPPAPSPAPAAASTPEAGSDASTASSETPAGSDEPLSLEELQASITAKAKTHRKEVVAILESFNAKRGGEVKPEDRAACNDKLLAIE